MVHNYGHGPVLLPKVVSDVRGPVSRVMLRHVDLMRLRWTAILEEEAPTTAPHDLGVPVPLEPTVAGQEPGVTEDSTDSGPLGLRCSSRQRRPPDRLIIKW